MMANKHEFSEKERQELADKDQAMPDGSFPIRNKQDLKDAIRSIGRASEDKRPDVKRFIKERAGDLDAEDELPEDW